MNALLLSVHILGAIIFIGPVTIATSLFPRYARLALEHRGRPNGADTSAVELLHRISRVYAVLGLSVPVFGVATAAGMGVLGDTWLIVSMALTLAAALLLALVLLPGQVAAMTVLRVERMPGESAATLPAAAPAAAGGVVASGLARLGMASGVFALIWSVVVVLMIVRPGSTTGV
ncbi:membrane protein [Streptomyces sp. 150FB]|uniref:hypothetical protein n=1 Tax=Streptomyces sp. 150FB TaxID=1576605 RepID=UPI0005893454|nr:hypothetical protein [Streptomyces sp. 150FB]KIF72940.1 membrane protein [Streptomyces sp. 150FB]